MSYLSASSTVVPNSGPVDPLGVHEGLAGGPRVMIIFFFIYFFFKINKYHLVTRLPSFSLIAYQDFS